MVFVSLVVGMPIALAQEVTFSWSGVVPIATSVLNTPVTPVITESNQVQTLEAQLSKQLEHPHIAIIFARHEVTNTEIKILKAEL